MNKFNCLEEIQVWQKARLLTIEINKLSFSIGTRIEYDLQRQARRSSASIAANIAEGYGRKSKKEFAHFLDIAYGSAVETKSHIYVAHDLGFIDRERRNDFLEMTDEISRMLFVLARRVRESSLK
jgi:four helix bundle protein